MQGKTSPMRPSVFDVENANAPNDNMVSDASHNIQQAACGIALDSNQLPLLWANVETVMQQKEGSVLSSLGVQGTASNATSPDSTNEEEEQLWQKLETGNSS
jgi:hypothetical protein